MEHLTQILQASIAPCILISGFGLLLLSMTNRFAKPVDRIRELVKDEKHAPDDIKPALQTQIRIFYKRSQLIRRAIISIVLGIIFASTVMLMTFSSLILGTSALITLIEISFALSLIFLISGLIFFLLDIKMTLQSLEIEAERHLKNI